MLHPPFGDPLTSIQSLLVRIDHLTLENWSGPLSQISTLVNEAKHELAWVMGEARGQRKALPLRRRTHLLERITNHLNVAMFIADLAEKEEAKEGRCRKLALVAALVTAAFRESVAAYVEMERRVPGPKGYVRVTDEVYEQMFGKRKQIDAQLTTGSRQPVPQLA